MEAVKLYVSTTRLMKQDTIRIRQCMSVEFKEFIGIACPLQVLHEIAEGYY
jgi:hypothetical protein